MKRKTAPAVPRFIVYARVSTDEQGRSRLGLEAQEAACARFVAEAGGEVVRSFREVASGDDDSRVELAAALKLAKRTGATLLVSKLDRLSRVVATIAGLMRDGTQFRVAELGSASTLELHIRATLAQEEREIGAARTRAALAALKARGVKLGSARRGHWKGREAARLRGAAKGGEAAARARHEANADLYREARAIIEATAELPLRAVAAELERAGILTPKGSATWTATAVKRLREQLA